MGHCLLALHSSFWDISCSELMSYVLYCAICKQNCLLCSTMCFTEFPSVAIMDNVMLCRLLYSVKVVHVHVKTFLSSLLVPLPTVPNIGIQDPSKVNLCNAIGYLHTLQCICCGFRLDSTLRAIMALWVADTDVHTECCKIAACEPFFTYVTHAQL